MNIVSAVTKSEASLNAFRWIQSNPVKLWKNDLNLTLVHVLTNRSNAGAALLRRYEDLAKEVTKKVSTKLLTRQGSVGKTLKEYMSTLVLEQPILVLGCTKQKWDVIDYCVERCECPVVIVKRDYSSFAPLRPVVGLAMDVNVHCDRAFTWLLKKADLPQTSQLYVVHITPKKIDKPDARRYLASLKPKCMESKRPYSMASALVSYDKGTVSDGIIRFCHDKDVATLIIPSKGDSQATRLRLSTSITEDCLRNSSVDVIIWQDVQTRVLNSSKYIFKVTDSSPLPLRLTPWDERKESNIPPLDTDQPKMDNDTHVKSEIKRKQSIPDQSDYSQPLSLPPEHEYSVQKKYLGGDSDTHPDKKFRRKSSLTYNVYDQIAKGKNLLRKLSGSGDDRYSEPLSP